MNETRDACISENAHNVKEVKQDSWRNEHRARKEQLQAHKEEFEKLKPADLSPHLPLHNYPAQSRQLPTFPPTTKYSLDRKARKRFSSLNSSTVITTSADGYKPTQSTPSPFVKNAVLSSSLYEVPKTLDLPITHSTTKLYNTALISSRGSELGTSTMSKYCPLSQGEEFKGSQLKIRQLENEVALLERQLAEKTLSTGQHIRELTDIRTELTQERSALSSLKQELNSKAAAKLEQAQKKHIQECQELQDMIGKLRNDRISAQKDLDKVKSLLKASLLESSAQSERLASLSSQLESERTSFSNSLKLLKLEVTDGCDRVVELEEALSSCQKELLGHVTIMEESSCQYESKIKQLQEQVEYLTTDLVQVRDQLLCKTGSAASLKEQLTKQEKEFKRNFQENKELHQSLSRKFQELKLLYEERTKELKVAEEKEKRLIFELKQEQLRNTELEVRLQHSEIMLQKVCQKRKQAEYSVEILRKEMDVKNDECEECRVRAKKSETEARKYEQEMEKLMGNMQQELASRTQQVMEMDELLRTFQMNSTACRLKLERALAQRQDELRTRTQEAEKLAIMLKKSKETEKKLMKEITLITQEKLTSGKNEDVFSRVSNRERAQQ